MFIYALEMRFGVTIYAHTPTDTHTRVRAVPPACHLLLCTASLLWNMYIFSRALSEWLYIIHYTPVRFEYCILHSREARLAFFWLRVGGGGICLLF